MRELFRYFQDVIRLLTGIDPRAMVVRGPRVVEYADQIGRLTCTVRYSDGSVLHVQLVADCSGDFAVWGLYGFQYVDRANELIFRYDNAPHHRDLPSFPDHLHISGVGPHRLLPYGPPTIHDLARAVRWHLDHPGERWYPTPH